MGELELKGVSIWIWILCFDFLPLLVFASLLIQVLYLIFNESYRYMSLILSIHLSFLPHHQFIFVLNYPECFLSPHWCDALLPIYHWCVISLFVHVYTFISFIININSLINFMGPSINISVFINNYFLTQYYNLVKLTSIVPFYWIKTK